MHLIAKKVLLLFEKGQTVLLDPTTDPNDHPDLAADGIQHNVEYEVVVRDLNCEGYSIRLKCPDGRYTGSLPLEHFIPKPK